jgi:hypothetical protein
MAAKRRRKRKGQNEADRNNCREINHHLPGSGKEILKGTGGAGDAVQLSFAGGPAA